MIHIKVIIQTHVFAKFALSTTWPTINNAKDAQLHVLHSEATHLVSKQHPHPVQIAIIHVLTAGTGLRQNMNADCEETRCMERSSLGNKNDPGPLWNNPAMNTIECIDLLKKNPIFRHFECLKTNSSRFDEPTVSNEKTLQK